MMNVTLTPSQMWIPGFTDRYFWDFSTDSVYSCVHPGVIAPYRMKYSTNDYVGLRPNPRTDRYASTQHFTRDDLKSLMDTEFKNCAKTHEADVIKQGNEVTTPQTEQTVSTEQSKSFYVFNTHTGIIVGNGEYAEMVQLAKKITLKTGAVCELLSVVAQTVPFEADDVKLKSKS
jgi:hypothetical protein